ncbi:MAG: FliH/SctL family protein [Eubacteriales bacterium]|jgi:flagellar assembly protein FliH|nr:hypothetical protein [Clostridiales bacterium]
MSTFRIDKQYVTIERAEQKTVHVGVRSTAGSSKARGDDVFRKNYDAEKIISIVTKKAEERAEAIIEEAKKKASLKISQAEKQAKAIKKEAEKISVEIKKRAQEEGYAAGRSEAEADIAKKLESDKREFQRLTDELVQNYSRIIDEARGDVISLIIDITKKILEIKLNESDDVFLELVNNAIDELKNSSYIKIHVSPEDFERYFGKGQALEKIKKETSATISVDEEEDFHEGDLVVESDGEVLDLSVYKQLDKIECAFINGNA